MVNGGGVGGMEGGGRVGVWVVGGGRLKGVGEEGGGGGESSGESREVRVEVGEDGDGSRWWGGGGEMSCRVNVGWGQEERGEKRKGVGSKGGG